MPDDMNERLKKIRDSFSPIDVRSGGDFFAKWMAGDEGVSSSATPSSGPTRPERAAGDTYPNHPLDYSQDEADTHRRQTNYAGESRDSYDSTRDPGSLDFKDPNGPSGSMGDGWHPGYESSSERQLGEMTRREFDSDPGQPSSGGGGFDTPSAGSAGGWAPPDAGGAPMSNEDPGMMGGSPFQTPDAGSDPSSGGYNPDPGAMGGDSPFQTPEAGSGDWSSGGGGEQQQQDPQNAGTGDSYAW